jgi:hypothetical protein
MSRQIYRDEDLINVNDCRKCKHHVGMYDTFVRCGRHQGMIVLVVTRPANWNKGFSNDDTVLYCTNLEA